MHHPTHTTYHSLCYSSCGALVGTRNIIYTITLTVHTTAFVTPVVEHWLEREILHTPSHSYYIPQPLLLQLWSTGWNEKYYIHHPTHTTYHSLCYSCCGALVGTRNIIYTIPLILHTTAFVTPVVEHWLEREILYTPSHSYYIPQPLLLQLWSTGWNEKYYIHHPTHSTYHSLCYSSCGALVGMRNYLWCA